MRKSLACIVLLLAVPVVAQNAPQSIALASKSTIPTADISKAFAKKCPSFNITADATKSDFGLEAITHKETFLKAAGFDLTLSDPDGIIFRSVSVDSLDNAVKELCRSLKAEIAIEVVDPENLTQSADVRGTGAGLGAVVNAATGRRTHTDSSTMAVVVNGEHALLDCYERKKGCVPIRPGKYYAELAVDKKSLWVDHDVPISHIHARDHYVIAGSW